MLIKNNAIWVDVNSSYLENSNPELLIDLQAITNSLFNLLSCPVGSRPHQRDYGCQLIAALFEPADGTTAEDIKFGLFQSIGRWEPRIEIDRQATTVTPTNTNDGFAVNLVFTISKTLEKARYQYTATRT